MSFLTKFLAIYYRTGWRGSWRISDLLASRLTSLQDVEIAVEGGILHADLRIGSARGILARPRSTSGEDKVMRQFVRDGDIVLDIGAHLGFYTLLLSKQVGENGKVFAFEPNVMLLESLRKTIAQKSNISLFECGLADKEGTLDLYVPEDASMGSLSDWTKGRAGSVQTISCKIEVIDNLINAGKIAAPNFIKCDVEGAELTIFSGAREMFDSKDAPIVLFELNKLAAASFGHTPEDYLHFFSSLKNPNYSFFQVFRDNIEPMQDWNLDYTNVLAIPESCGI
jgi:FkbM family methyltransferase